MQHLLHETLTPEECAPRPELQLTTECLRDQLWRLNNLYWIIDENGKRVKFVMNEAQLALYNDMWYFNVVLKARQLGFTTFIDIFGLDTAVFNEHFHFGIIADKLQNAKNFFDQKIKFPYDNLPEGIRSRIHATTDRAGELKFSNGSKIIVDTSLRSGSYQMLHVSEYGKISAQDPAKALEIKTGGFETVHAGSMIFIESTAEGKSGEFFDICDRAMKADPDKLTMLDFKFHFFPWWKKKSYVLDPTNVVITDTMRTYFRSLEDDHGIELSRAQKAWYVVKRGRLGDHIFREHPSIESEAFNAKIKGAYFAEEMLAAYKSRRITLAPHKPGVSVDTWWDIGVNDDTAIWFTQNHGRQIVLIGYYENNGYGLKHYADLMGKLRDEEGYHFGTHNGPHDLGVQEFGSGKTRVETAADLGIKFNVIPRVKNKADSIQAARNLIPYCVFDEVHTEIGIVHLENYRKEFDDKRGVYRDKPLHDKHSNAADAFQTLAMGHSFHTAVGRRINQKPKSPKGWT